MAHDSYCMECGVKGRTHNGLCHECELELLNEAHDQGLMYEPR